MSAEAGKENYKLGDGKEKVSGRMEKERREYMMIVILIMGQPKKKRMAFTPLTSNEVKTTPFTIGPHMLSFSGSLAYFSYKS